MSWAVPILFYALLLCALALPVVSFLNTRKGVADRQCDAASSPRCVFHPFHDNLNTNKGQDNHA